MHKEAACNAVDDVCIASTCEVPPLIGLCVYCINNILKIFLEEIMILEDGAFLLRKLATEQTTNVKVSTIIKTKKEYRIDKLSQVGFSAFSEHRENIKLRISRNVSLYMYMLSSRSVVYGV